jgi:DNA-directed RNA polymerase I, II, and III subunit RPABC4
MHQKRASNLIMDGCEPPCGCRNFNSGPSKEQSVLLTTEPSLQPHINILIPLKYPISREGMLLAVEALTMDAQKDVQPPKQQPMIYICGECHTENEIKSRDPIRCRECGYRIMYRKRTKRLVVFDAR